MATLPDPAIRKGAVGPTILLQSGHHFDLLDPANSRFEIEDIAHGLGMTCRFAGQCARFYSVAEHSWHASYLVPKHLRLTALLHDAAEAFLGDVTRPLKSLLPDYKRIEAQVEGAVFERLGVRAPNDPAIKDADRRMLVAERAALLPEGRETWTILDGVPCPDIRFRFWDPVEGKREFLRRYWLLRADEGMA